MEGQILCKKEIELLGKKYLVYLKEVATKIAKGGRAESTAVKAFVRRK